MAVAHGVFLFLEPQRTQQEMQKLTHESQSRREERQAMDELGPRSTLADLAPRGVRLKPGKPRLRGLRKLRGVRQGDPGPG